MQSLQHKITSSLEAGDIDGENAKSVRTGIAGLANTKIITRRARTVALRAVASASKIKRSDSAPARITARAAAPPPFRTGAGSPRVPSTASIILAVASISPGTGPHLGAVGWTVIGIDTL